MNFNHDMNMKKILIFSILLCFAAVGCTNMNPDIKFDPAVDAEAFCEIGKKDSKVASSFWDKVEVAYNEKSMYAELDEFESIIVSQSQAAAQEHPVRLANRGVRAGEVSYYPEGDAQTYLQLAKSSQNKAEEFLNEVQELYNEDGLYEDLEIFMQICGLESK